MRCVKCGYYSFDYLSECKKCRTNLADVRQRLGFSGATPAIQSVLGPLFRGYEPVANHASEPVAIATSDPLDFDEKFEAAPWPSEHDSETMTPPPIADKTEEAEEDFSLLDLSDEELDLLIDKAAFSNGDLEQAISTPVKTDDADFALPKSLSPPEPAPLVLAAEPAEIQTPAPPESDDLELIFEPDAHLPETRDETPADASPVAMNPDLTLNLTELDEVPGIAASEFEPFLEPDEPPSDKSEDDFVIDLSEDDLDSLLVELSHPPKEEAAAESKA
jgi:hypothetical protein